jgi:divalent metal cation (Fe/Co/Zn/Cd) transporter
MSRGAPGSLVGINFEEKCMRDEGPVRAGLKLSAISLAWTILSGGAAVGIGIAHGSLVLIAFGATNALDAVGSATLVLHFRHALHHDVFSDRRERIALHVITIGLVVLGLATAGESVHRLFDDARPGSAPEGVVLASASAVILAVLGSKKRRVAPSIPSGALAADGWVSTTGAVLATVTVMGTAISAAGWHWVDAVASLVVAVGAVGIAFELRRG